MKYYPVKYLVGITLLTLVIKVSALDSQSDPASAICNMYANMQYSQARILAAKYPNLQESRIIKALCAVYDRRKQNLQYGLPELKKIYENVNFRLELRLQAGLAYARAGQTLQQRKGIYPVADGINYESVYNKIVYNYPSSDAACFAITYQTEGWFKSGDEHKIANAFLKLRKYLQGNKAPKRYLAALNILLADKCIIHRKQYDSAVKYLVSAYNSGIHNPRTNELVLYRIGRIYDIKLHNRPMAEKYYKIYMTRYPDAAYATIVSRFFKELSYNAEEEKK